MVETVLGIISFIIIVFLLDLGIFVYKFKKRKLEGEESNKIEESDEFSQKTSKSLKSSKNKEANQEKLSSCPVCLTKLKKGENLFSKVYGSSNQNNQRCIINGCPHCFPVCEKGVERNCPVCGKAVSSKDGYLVARLFNKTEDGKKHVIVTGCNKCCNPYSK